MIYFYIDSLPLFAHRFVLQRLPSYLRTFVPSYLRTFVPSNKYPKYLRKNNTFVLYYNIKFSKGRIVCVIVCVVYAYILFVCIVRTN